MEYYVDDWKLCWLGSVIRISIDFNGVYYIMTELDEKIEVYLEAKGLDKELDKLTNFIVESGDDWCKYITGEKVSRREHYRRMERAVEILTEAKDNAHTVILDLKLYTGELENE